MTMVITLSRHEGDWSSGGEASCFTVNRHRRRIDHSSINTNNRKGNTLGVGTTSTSNTNTEMTMNHSTNSRRRHRISWYGRGSNNINSLFLNDTTNRRGPSKISTSSRSCHLARSTISVTSSIISPLLLSVVWYYSVIVLMMVLQTTTKTTTIVTTTNALLPPFVLTNQLATITTTTTTGSSGSTKSKSVNDGRVSSLSARSPWRTTIGGGGGGGGGEGISSEEKLSSKTTTIFNNNWQQESGNTSRRTSTDSNSSSSSSSTTTLVPFVIQQVERGMQGDYKEISTMCIDVFFREGTITTASSKEQEQITALKGNNNSSPLFTIPKFMTPVLPRNGSYIKEAAQQQQQEQQQSLVVNGSKSNSSSPLLSNMKNPFLGMNLAFLRNAQYGDLTTRKFNHPKENAMFVAREVIQCTTSGNRKRTSGINMKLKNSNNNNKNNLSSRGRRVSLNGDETIYNIRSLGGSNNDDNVEYITGDVIGFVEVTARPFALGQNYNDFTETGRVRKRPVLANLAVAKRARGSGVGSKLVKRCEHICCNEWKYNEIILQVEDNNGKAQNFYEKRSYKVIFSDPASRTYDTSGFFPKQIRTTKLCMRKELLVRPKLLRSQQFLLNQKNEFIETINGKQRNQDGTNSSSSSGLGKMVFDMFKQKTAK